MAGVRTLLPLEFADMAVPPDLKRILHVVNFNEKSKHKASRHASLLERDDKALQSAV